ncbi:MbnP family protein [uncultured Polaribacter sp.]|uniref:MbnP family protein n=1 Tax=uncultured Polaribacter sp. TaxID=174711 RepID=UPI00261DFC35|nr:MbnP family protein [uncultured Polaribacter sp.]
MKKIVSLFLIVILFSSCKDDVECCVNPGGSVTLKFTHNWNGTPITEADFNQLKFTNANGDQLSIEKLRYVITNINLLDTKNRNLVDLGQNTGLSLTIPNQKADLINLKFRFGFKDEDNTDGIYQDLNTVNFNVPNMLGGGYHYMQFDGKFVAANNQEAGFNYHAIRAVNRTDPNNLVFKDTSFEVDLGEIEIINDTTIEIKMNVAEWFKNPNTWNLNELNTVLMPNFDAQILMNENGQSVFSLGEITQ